MSYTNEGLLDSTLSAIEDFTADLRANYRPPAIPYDKEKSARGWSMRLASIDEKIKPLSRSETLRICSRLAVVLSELDAYLSEWEARLDDMDPNLVDYKFMPGDFDAIESVRVIAERVNLALYDVFAAHFGID